MSGKDREFWQPEALNADEAVQAAAALVMAQPQPQCAYCLRHFPLYDATNSAFHDKDCAWLRGIRALGGSR